VIGGQRVLVVAAHPDDEILGCGGTVARHARAGDPVDILILSEGATSRDPFRVASTREPEMEGLRHAAASAARVLGARPPRFVGFPDNRLDEVAFLDIVKAIEAVVADVTPTVVYTHHAHDLNIDHRLACQATLTACRPLPGAAVRAIFSFETVSSSEWGVPGPAMAFAPTGFVDIADVLTVKREALACYAAEMRAFPHPRSFEAIDALARWRGASAGLVAAEAFSILRMVTR
jgi:N-acetylglucosamine malate deacetylase 1